MPTRIAQVSRSIQLDLCRCQRDELLQPSDEIQVMVVALPPLAIREAERQPDLRMSVHKIRATCQYADYLKPAPVNVDGAADHWPRPPRQTALITKQVHSLRLIEVNAKPDGFEYRGKHYAALSTIACQATGTRWNG